MSSKLCEIRRQAATTVSELRYLTESHAQVPLTDALTPGLVPAEGLISPALLGRARSIAAEHSKLSELLVRNFDPKVARKAGELSNVASILKAWEHASEVRRKTVVQVVFH